MKRNSSAIITGGVLVLIGLFIVIKALGFLDFSFDGWWTLFIIIPCTIGVINGDSDSRTASIIGVGLGVLLLCCAQGWIRWGMFAPTLLAVVLVVIGLRMIIVGPSGKQVHQNPNNPAGNYYQAPNGTQNVANGQTQQTNGNPTTYTYNPNTNTYETNDVHFTSDTGAQSAGNQNSGQQGQNGGQGGNGGSNGNFNRGSAQNDGYGNCVCTAVLSGREIRYDGEVFRSGMLSAFLGGLDLDLRTAVITGTVVIEARAVLGGIEIYTPRYTRTIVNGAPVLGGIENSSHIPQGANDQTPTIIVNASCVLGSIEVK